MRRDERAGAEDDFRSACFPRAALAIPGDPYRAFALHQHARRLPPCQDREVGPIADWVEIGGLRRHPLAAALGEGVIAEAVLPFAVEIGGERIAGFDRCIE